MRGTAGRGKSIGREAAVGLAAVRSLPAVFAESFKTRAAGRQCHEAPARSRS